MPDSRPAAIRTAVTESVHAALAGDAERFQVAAAALGKLDPAQLTVVQATTIRQLLELLHPDGLASEDVQQVLAETAARSASWWPELDAEVLVTVLLSALGAAAPEPGARPPAGVAVHANLVIAELIARQPAPLAGYLDQALAEIRRAETIEMP